MPTTLETLFLTVSVCVLQEIIIKQTCYGIYILVIQKRSVDNGYKAFIKWTAIEESSSTYIRELSKNNV